MALEVKILDDGKIVARRSDGQPLTDTDKAEVKNVAEQIETSVLCWNCGQPWTEFTNSEGETYQVCWACAKTA